MSRLEERSLERLIAADQTGHGDAYQAGLAPPRARAPEQPSRLLRDDPDLVERVAQRVAAGDIAEVGIADLENDGARHEGFVVQGRAQVCLLYTSDAAD